MLVVKEPGAKPSQATESRHGVTPAMRDARRRHFRQLGDVDPGVVAQVEADLLAILSVSGCDDLLRQRK